MTDMRSIVGGHPVRLESATYSGIVTSDTDCYCHGRRSSTIDAKIDATLRRQIQRSINYLYAVTLAVDGTEIMINRDVDG